MSIRDREPAADEGRRSSRADADRRRAPDVPRSPDLARDRGRLADRPSQVPKRGWKDILIRTWREVRADNIPMVAAAAAFYAWLALLPSIIAAVTLYGLLASPEQVSDQISQLTKNLSDEVATTLAQPVEQATDAGGRGLSIGLGLALLGALWSASGGMNGLIQGINIAYDETDDRNFLAKRGLAVLLTLGAIVGFLVAIALVAAFPPLVDAVGLPAIGRIGAEVLRWVLLAVLMVAGLAILYRYAPDRENPRFRWASWGSVLATVLWLGISAGFSFYVGHFGSYNKTYGALAGVVILNLWLYLTCLILLVGAEMNAEMEAQTARDTTTGRRKPLGQRRAHKADELGELT